jgi:hypothetical protein
MTNVQMPKLQEDFLWVRGIHTSQWAGVIYYGSVSHYDPGVTYLDWNSGRSMYDSQKVASVYDRDFILAGISGTSRQLQLVRDEPLFLVEGGYYIGSNKITLTATDDDGTTAVTANLIVLEHLWDKIKLKNNIGNIELNANQELIYSF